VAWDIVTESLIGNIRLAQWVIPALGEARIMRIWLGLEAEVADAMPMVGPVPGVLDAFVIGSVHSGYTSGPYTGWVLARLILGHEPEHELFDPSHLLGPARLRREIGRRPPVTAAPGIVGILCNGHG
jgi:glycine/D-amino acid oxidase-like deaminating enzyme